MAEDLAIDVGIPADTDEFHTFVSCVNNLLEHGCTYGKGVTDNICEKCEKSDLPIAKKVLRECRRVAKNTSRIRPSKLKWWQTWENSSVPRWPGRSPSPQQTRKRPMSPMFRKKQSRQDRRQDHRQDRRQDRRQDYQEYRDYQDRRPREQGRRKRARAQRREHPYKRPNEERPKRPMSPLFQKKDVKINKRRRYR